MPDLNQKFAKEMLIDCLAELANKYQSRLPEAAQCISCVATAMRASEVEHLASFLRIFENAINGKGKTNAAKS